ncbi:MAG: hypothetical protein HFE39_07310 [Clostridiales bacterium]|jgi:hypothetical protein|nr:hypothetical protein [Clostridiales bacterium]
MRLLTTAQQALVALAIQHGCTIIIDGDRNYPTGKSTLCEELKKQGAHAVETWELEEGGVRLPAEGNHVTLLIQLNRPLSESV